VPAPIYLTSERTIDAKIGSESLREILTAGAIGLLAIIAFLIYMYRVSGLLAGLALITYTLILIALVKMTGVVLTLASIA
jgi:preprotein translocase subunit SecD